MTDETEMGNEELLAKDATEAGFPCAGWVQDIAVGQEVFLPQVVGDGTYRNVTGTVIRINPDNQFAYSFVLLREDGVQVILFFGGSWPCYFREPVMPPFLKSLLNFFEKVREASLVKDEPTEDVTFKNNRGGDELIIKRFEFTAEQKDDLSDEEAQLVQWRLQNPVLIRRQEAWAKEQAPVEEGAYEPLIPDVDPQLEALLKEEDEIEAEQEAAREAERQTERRKHVLEHQMPDVD